MSEQSREEEHILATQMSCRFMGGVNMMGGRIVLTDRRLVFLPLINRSRLRLSSLAASASQRLHDWDLSPQRLLNLAIMPLTKPIEIPLGRIQDVTATSRCAVLVRWMGPTRQKKAEFGVFATSRFSPYFNRVDIPLRDQFLAEIEAALPDRSGK